MARPRRISLAEVIPPEDTAFEEDAFDTAIDDEEFVEFKSMGWIQAGFVSLADSIALDLMSFPSIFMRLGLVGGLIATLGLGAMAYITAWIMVDFKVKHPGVLNFADAGTVMFGKWGGRVFGMGFFLKSIGLAASHVLSGQIALKEITAGTTCNIIWGAVIAVVAILLSLQRQFSKLTIISVASISAIVIASFVSVISTGVEGPRHLAPTEPVVWYAFHPRATLVDVVVGIASLIFAYGGNMAVFTFCSEMRQPEDFKKSFAIVQVSGTVCYCIIGCLGYVYGGQYVVAPFFTMASRPIKIATYSLSLITVLFSGVVAVDVGAKHAYVELYRGTEILTSKSKKASIKWVMIVAGMWSLGFLVAELIPFFDELLAIVSALFGSWFAYGAGGMLWFYLVVQDEKNRSWQAFVRSKARVFLSCCSAICILMSLVMSPLGVYSAVQAIIKGYKDNEFKHVFSCSI